MSHRIQPRITIQRDDIREKIREIRVEPGKALRQVEVPKSVYDMAGLFAQWAPNRTKTGAQYRFKMEFIYDLLIGNCKSPHLVEAREEIEGWQTACKALLRYALNLLLAPKRPEFRRMKLSSSFYVYQVSKKLSSADKILVFMGYKRISSGSQEIQELNYEGDVDTSKVLETAADLVILHSELELVKQLVERVRGEPALAATITLQEILRARSENTYNETWPYLMTKGYTPQQPAAQVDFQTQQGYQSFQRQASSGQYPNQTVPEAIRRGSAPLLSTDERMLHVREPRPALTLTPPLLKRGTAAEAYSAPGRGYVPTDQPLQLPPQHHHQQHARSAPSSVRESDKPGSSVDKHMAEVNHDVHEKIHAKLRHNRVEEMATLTRAPEQVGCAPHVSAPFAQSHYNNLPLISASKPTHMSFGVQDTTTADGLYHNIQGLAKQVSPVAADGEPYMLPHQTVPPPYQAGLVTRGADGYDQPGTVQSPFEPPSEYQTAEYQKHHAQLDDSVKVKQVEDLFQKFPDLVPGQKPKSTETGSEDPANIYQNIPGPAQGLESPSGLPFKLPEPIVDSEAELQKLAHQGIPRDSIMSGIKNVRSVDYDSTPGPEDFLSGLSHATTPQTPCLIQNQHEVDAWAIHVPPDASHQPHSYPSSSGSNKDKHSPGSSLGDNMAFRKHSSRSGSESEDLYNSEPSGEFDHSQRKGAPSKQILTVQETDETTKPEDGVVKDGVTSTSEALKSRTVADSSQPKPTKPIPAKRKLVSQKQQSVEVDTPPKPSVLPRKCKSGSNLLDLPSSEEADTHSPVFSDPSSPTASSEVPWKIAPSSPSEDVRFKVPASQPQAKPIPMPRSQSSFSSGESTESKDESSLDRKQQPRTGGFQHPAGRPEQYFRQYGKRVPPKHDKTPPTTNVSYATAKSPGSASIPHTAFDKGNRDSTGHPRATLNQPEYPNKEPSEKQKKLSAAGSLTGDTSATLEMSNITPSTPDDQRRDDLLQKVPNFETKWICSYCMNIVYDPTAVACDVCSNFKNGVLGDHSSNM